jgi:hypothetical protein
VWEGSSMRRKLLGFVAALSLPLFVAVCVLWVRSYRTPAKPRFPAVDLNFGTPGRTVWIVRASRGSMTLGRVRWDDPALGGRPSSWSHGRWRFYANRHYWVDPVGKYGSLTFLTSPCWAVTLVLSLLPSGRSYCVVREWRRTRLLGNTGRCPTCGYDLRATPDQCPECGAVPDGLKKQAAE